MNWKVSRRNGTGKPRNAETTLEPRHDRQVTQMTGIDGHKLVCLPRTLRVMLHNCAKAHKSSLET